MPRALPATIVAACLLAAAGCTGGPAPAGPGASTAGTAPIGSPVGTAAPSGDPQVAAAVTAYRTYLLGELATLRVRTTAFTRAVRDGDVERAKTLYAPSRASWERVGPVVAEVSGLGEAVDGQVPAAGPADPGFTGWHRLEYLLWARGTTAGAKPVADRLDRDLATVAADTGDALLTARLVLLGAAALTRGAAGAARDGREDRYSHTDLWDVSARLDGARSAVLVFEGLLAHRDNALLGRVRAQFAAVDASLGPYQSDVGSWAPFTAVPPAVRARLRAELLTLTGSLESLPAALGV